MDKTNPNIRQVALKWHVYWENTKIIKKTPLKVWDSYKMLVEKQTVRIKSKTPSFYQKQKYTSKFTKNEMEVAMQ